MPNDEKYLEFLDSLPFLNDYLLGILLTREFDIEQKTALEIVDRWGATRKKL